MNNKIHIEYTFEADQDIIDIWSYSNDQWNSSQADKYLDQLNDAFELLCKNPKLGKDFSYAREGYRCFTINHHKIFYKIYPEYIEIIRVLHESMDIDRHL